MTADSCLGGLAVMTLARNARDQGSIPHWGIEFFGPGNPLLHLAPNYGIYRSICMVKAWQHAFPRGGWMWWWTVSCLGGLAVMMWYYGLKLKLRSKHSNLYLDQTSLLLIPAKVFGSKMFSDNLFKHSDQTMNASKQRSNKFGTCIMPQQWGSKVLRHALRSHINTVQSNCKRRVGIINWNREVLTTCTYVCLWYWIFWTSINLHIFGTETSSIVEFVFR